MCRIWRGAGGGEVLIPAAWTCWRHLLPRGLNFHLFVFVPFVQSHNGPTEKCKINEWRLTVLFCLI